MIKTRKYILAAKLLAVLMIGSCTLLASTTKTNATNIKFKDQNFQKAVFENLGVTSPDLDEFEKELATSMYLDDNNVWSLEGIQNLYNMEYLFIQNSNIADLTPLSNLQKIDDLTINNSCVTNLSALRNLTNLKSLHCENLNLDDYSAIATLQNLETLELNNCNIKDLSVLKNLKNLKELSLQDNYIEDISVLKNQKSLDKINLHNNEIKDITSLNNLDGGKEDKNINLDNNMIDNNENFSNGKILKTLKNKGYTIECSVKKDDIHVMKLDNMRFTFINNIDKKQNLFVEFNKNIENLKGKLEVCLFDSKDENINDDDEKKVNYIINDNLLIINIKDAFLKSDINTIAICEKHDDIYNVIDFLALSKYGALKGDINENGKIDLLDLTTISKDYNKNSKDALTWNINEDTNKDGIIDIYDITKVASQLDL